MLPPFDAQAAQQWCAAHAIRAEKNFSVPHAIALPSSVTEREAGGKDEVLLLPEVAQVRNPRLLCALRSRVEALGGRIVEQCAVRDIVVKGGQVQALATACGAFSAQSYIVTAGAWSKEVMGRYALNLDIKPVRGQMLLFRFAAPPLRLILLQGDLYLIPRRDGRLLVGSTLEDVGFDKQTTVAARDDLHQRAQNLLPSLRDAPLEQHWAGLRPASPRNIPTIGRHPLLDNLYLNSGHFRYGVTMAPASAEILLNEMAGTPQPFDVTPYQAGWGL